MNEMATTLELPKPIAEHEHKRKTEGLMFVVISGDFERVFAAFTLASTAAASGLPAKMFFTFWGLFALVKNGQMTGKNWMQKMMSFINRGGTEHLKHSLAQRALQLQKRVGVEQEITFVGGMARQHGMVRALETVVGGAVNVPAEPELVAALGAALLGRQRHAKQREGSMAA